jgi:hypothetical protein
VRDGSAVSAPEPCSACGPVPERDHLGLLIGEGDSEVADVPSARLLDEVREHFAVRRRCR